MQKAKLAAIGLAAVICRLALLPASAAPPVWRLVWSDEFNAPPGTPPDSTKWVYDLGAGGWGNQELETYTDSRANAYQDGHGHLVIQALERTPGQFTSARLKTESNFSTEYGRIEARIKIPNGQGIWPAFWMLGAHVNEVGWPESGEIDIMENIGREPAIVHCTVHGPGYSHTSAISRPFTLGSGRFADDFHIYTLEWSARRLEFSVDGTSYQTVTPASLPGRAKWVFDQPFYLILNVAVGGEWPGPPDATTAFPQRMLVDYVRVYHRQPKRYKRE